MSQNENLLDVVALLYKWKKRILGAAFVAAVIAAICSLMLPNYYQAHTLFYAASPDLAAPMPVGVSNEKKYIYGDDTDLDRLFSIAQSNALKTFLLEKFDLYTHYDINKEDPLAKHKLSLKLQKLYTTTKTKYDAIDLAVEDKDPEFAANMANAACEKINQLSQSIVKESYNKQIKAYKNALDHKSKIYNSLIDSLNNTSEKYGIFSTDSQGESYGSMLIEVEGALLNATSTLSLIENSRSVTRDSIRKVQAQKSGLESQLTKLKKDINNFNVGFPIVKNLERLTRDQSGQLNLDRTRLASLENAYDSEITALHIIERAETPPYKSRPRRSILVLMTAIITTILMSLWVIIRDQSVRQNWVGTIKNK